MPAPNQEPTIADLFFDSSGSLTLLLTASVTDEDGHYTIEGLEPGTYEVEVWQELWAAKLGAMRFSVTIEDGEPKRCDLAYTAGNQPEVRTR